jgi:omega-6 fatty acid desaturase / acyl-lipid omega-6 desaturase (Delta-12 desaturase)
MTKDQAYVPRTRSELHLPPLNSEGESHLGASISKQVMNELHEAIGDSPIGAVFGSGVYLVRHYELNRVS